MRVITLSVVTGCILLLVGCIPSIHGIVTDERRLIDDRILGTWEMGDGGMATIHISGEADPQEQADDEVEIWTIERAADITYTIIKDGVEHQSTLIEGAQSMVPAHASVVSKDEKPYYFLKEVSIEKGDTLTNQIIMQLTNVGGETFVDFKPYQGSENLEAFSLFYPNIIPAHTFGGMQVDNGKLIIRPFNSEYIEELIRTKRIRLKHEITAGGDIVLTASTEDLRAFIGKYAENDRLYESSWNFRCYNEIFSSSTFATCYILGDFLYHPV